MEAECLLKQPDDPDKYRQYYFVNKPSVVGFVMERHRYILDHNQDHSQVVEAVDGDEDVVVDVDKEKNRNCLDKTPCNLHKVLE